MIDIRVRFPVDDVILGRLHGRAFGALGDTADQSWAAQLERHSLTWVGAFDGAELIGFVNVCWDGGAHAFILDAVVDPGYQCQGIGRRLVDAAVAEAAQAGCEWVHVDFEPRLSAFYLDACGFRSTAAGVRHLGPRLEAEENIRRDLAE